ncbi:MAG TPA: L,D-transpeptidase family protein, partial [Vicinamibacterales bacterium]|nr:L,D-transpeptidase family protein [Vicinamibacterales bacterium]
GEVTMRVVVGKTTSKTPVFDGDLRHVVFRPYWSVPPSIQRHEIAPKVARDHSWLARNGYEIVGASGPVNAAMVEKIRTLQVQVRQKPGNSNSLGLVKFLFPNGNNVYLHDTPSQSHFARASRAYSHGCIRLAEPEALAAWVLRDKSEWTPEKVQKAMRGQRDDIYVKVDRPIAVLIVYETAVAQPNGEVHFFEDVYGHDTKLMAALRPAKEKVLVAQGAAGAQVASR